MKIFGCKTRNNLNNNYAFYYKSFYYKISNKFTSMPYIFIRKKLEFVILEQK